MRTGYVTAIVRYSDRGNTGIGVGRMGIGGFSE